ncbi:DUF6221 family protein [Saccharopolyspora sp. NFXS83]|uniref:DUF6221 family protein n=1 Tax=Saccharopolyspora sp. NFXS83 TaxID=2993560 RepID=UPI00224B8293|nr:DUF6221 family protein [Saccharopolyspora sp. NFXS83]MCX2732676.1 DUF6221 family protein [Saccharopolyspora sp. NFXS83]
MNRFAEFLRRQIDIDLELLRWAREDLEAGTTTTRCGGSVFRGFRECELKTRLLRLHQHCGVGGGPCDELGQTYPPEDERGCTTRALLGLPYSDRPGYRARWRP